MSSCPWILAFLADGKSHEDTAHCTLRKPAADLAKWDPALIWRLTNYLGLDVDILLSSAWKAPTLQWRNEEPITGHYDQVRLVARSCQKGLYLKLTLSWLVAMGVGRETNQVAANALGLLLSPGIQASRLDSINGLVGWLLVFFLWWFSVLSLPQLGIF